jgi:hypothetical protein
VALKPSPILRVLLFAMCLLVASAHGEAKRSKPSPSHLQLRAGVASWQGSVGLVADAGDSYSAVSSIVAAQLGLAWSMHLAGRWFLEFGAAGALGQGEAAVGDTITYTAQNVAVLGAQGEIGIYRMVVGRSFIGLVVPLVLHLADWPSPPGFTARGSPLSTGLCLEYRLGKGRWDLSPRVGFIGSLRSVYWSLGGVYRFL